MKRKSQQIIPIAAEQKQQIAALTETILQLENEMEQFLQLASHELKAPLRKINTFTERFLEKYGYSLNEEGSNYLLRIKKNIDAMQSLIDGFTRLSKSGMEKGVGKNFSICDLNEVANRVLEEFSPLILEKNATVTLSPLPVLEGNFSQLKELFAHLIDNSLKFQPENQAPDISIEASELKNDEKGSYGLPLGKKYFKINFKDNGIGLKENQRELLFKPLVRLNGKSAFEGNGLGLALCKKIAGAHHGIICAYTNNSGCRITLILPQTANNADSG